MKIHGTLLCGGHWAIFLHFMSMAELQNFLWQLLISDCWSSPVEFLHVKPGKGAAFVRTKLRNYITGNTVEKTFRAGSSVGNSNFQFCSAYHTKMDSWRSTERLIQCELSTIPLVKFPWEAFVSRIMLVVGMVIFVADIVSKDFWFSVCCWILYCLLNNVSSSFADLRIISSTYVSQILSHSEKSCGAQVYVIPQCP